MPDPLLAFAQALNGANTPPNAIINNWNGKSTKGAVYWISQHHYAPCFARIPDTIGLHYFPVRVAPGACILMKSPNNDVYSDFFSKTNDLFPTTNSRNRFFCEASEVDLLAFSLIKNAFSEEQNLTNLLIASGVIHSALDLDRPFSLVMPATSNSGGKTPFQLFNNDPNNNIDYTVDALTQVEVDIVVSGIKDGRAKLYVIESKNGSVKDIVNWKFLYPSKILFESLDDDIDVDVIPAFLNVRLNKNRIEFDLATFQPITNEPLNIINPIADQSTKGWMKWG